MGPPIGKSGYQHPLKGETRKLGFVQGFVRRVPGWASYRRGTFRVGVAAKAPPLLNYIVLGAALLTLGGLVWVLSGAPRTMPEPAVVALRIIGPDDRFVFNASELAVDFDENTVLGVLLHAATVGNFSVDVTYGSPWGAFVRSIAGIPNEGACGWVWDRNQIRGDRAADRQSVRTGDEILWHWDCES